MITLELFSTRMSTLPDLITSTLTPSWVDFILFKNYRICILLFVKICQIVFNVPYALQRGILNEVSIPIKIDLRYFTIYTMILWLLTGNIFMYLPFKIMIFFSANKGGETPHLRPLLDPSPTICSFYFRISTTALLVLGFMSIDYLSHFHLHNLLNW